MDSVRVEVQFLATEVRTGLTFADLALSSDNEQKCGENTEKAKTAYFTMLRFISEVEMTKEESQPILKDLDFLRDKLAQLGYAV